MQFIMVYDLRKHNVISIIEIQYLSHMPSLVYFWSFISISIYFPSDFQPLVDECKRFLSSSSHHVYLVDLNAAVSTQLNSLMHFKEVTKAAKITYWQKHVQSISIHGLPLKHEYFVLIFDGIIKLQHFQDRYI